MTHLTKEQSRAMAVHALLKRFEELDLDIETIVHPSAEAAPQHNTHHKGEPSLDARARAPAVAESISRDVCLFLEDAEARQWLVLVFEGRSVDLSRLGKVLGAEHLTFGSASRLSEVLGVEPDEVTPFALINDYDLNVEVVLDRELLDARVLCYSPLQRGQCTRIKPSDLLTFIETCGHEMQIVDFEDCPYMLDN